MEYTKSLSFIEPITNTTKDVISRQKVTPALALIQEPIIELFLEPIPPTVPTPTPTFNRIFEPIPDFVFEPESTPPSTPVTPLFRDVNLSGYEDMDLDSLLGLFGRTRKYRVGDIEKAFKSFKW